MYNHPPCSWFTFFQACFEVHFFYFGLHFCHVNRKLQDLHAHFPLSEFTHDDEMVQIIQKDLRQLRTALVGGKKKYDVGTFVRVPDTKIYVYHHNHHSYATCSGTTFSQLNSLTVNIQEGEEMVSECAENIDHHYNLLPFFVNNKRVLEKYTTIAARHGNENIKSEAAIAQRIIEGKISLYASDLTSFPTHSDPHTCNWTENDWTKRLVPGLRKLLTKNIEYTAEMGPLWHDALIHKILGIEGVAADVFLFRGSPDIVIGGRGLMTMGSSEEPEEEESSGNDSEALVENAHQRHPMKGAYHAAFPEKLGEVFAGLYILLVSKTLRQLTKPTGSLDPSTLCSLIHILETDPE